MVATKAKAKPKQTKPKPAPPPVPPPDVPALCKELQELQRRRSVVMKSRNMQQTRLVAVAAGALGYSAGLAEKDREARFEQARKLVAGVVAGKVDHPFARIIRETMAFVDAFNAHLKELDRDMTRVAAKLPVAAWVKAPGQRGFGLLMLAIIIGETGDLNNYANPAKVWARLGCAPRSFNGQTLMPATWRAGKFGKLPASEWESAGYSPRRRCVAYLVGEGLVKQNTVRATGAAGERCCVTEVASVRRPGVSTKRKAGGKGESTSVTERPSALLPGPYRQRYDEAKAALAAKHPKDPAYPKLRCHRHGMLLATKLLLKLLWRAWRGRVGEEPVVTEPGSAAPSPPFPPEEKPKAKPRKRALAGAT